MSRISCHARPDVLEWSVQGGRDRFTEIARVTGTLLTVTRRRHSMCLKSRYC